MGFGIECAESAEEQGLVGNPAGDSGSEPSVETTSYEKRGYLHLLRDAPLTREGLLWESVFLASVLPERTILFRNVVLEDEWTGRVHRIRITPILVDRLYEEVLPRLRRFLERGIIPKAGFPGKRCADCDILELCHA